MHPRHERPRGLMMAPRQDSNLSTGSGGRSGSSGPSYPFAPVAVTGGLRSTDRLRAVQDCECPHGRGDGAPLD